MSVLASLKPKSDEPRSMVEINAKDAGNQANHPLGNAVRDLTIKSIARPFLRVIAVVGIAAVSKLQRFEGISTANLPALSISIAHSRTIVVKSRS
jgi:hypothetical protein